MVKNKQKNEQKNEFSVKISSDPPARMEIFVNGEKKPSIILYEGDDGENVLGINGKPYRLIDVFGDHDICGHPEWGDADRCPKNHGGEHMPDLRSARQADSDTKAVDVVCANCGRSGSIPYSVEDTQW